MVAFIETEVAIETKVTYLNLSNTEATAKKFASTFKFQRGFDFVIIIKFKVTDQN